ncbi:MULTISPECIES: hypothetical protein [Rhizobium]|uniref:hypothetical protein n=1 Tax=Rhizobium TaxID=379 RepID=UPI001952B0BC|nr:MULTISPECIES: hypothetical protein [Rhizobium]
MKQRDIATTAYAAGLRASEAVHVKVRDIDGERGKTKAIMQIPRSKCRDSGFVQSPVPPDLLQLRFL